KDGVMIPGANGPCLVFPSVSLGDGGNYCVKVTGPYNSVTNCAPLTVQTLTTTVGPANQTVCPGSTLNLCTEPCGLGPFSYMWFKNGVLIPGALSSCLSIPNVGLSDAGTYCVKVTGLLNSVTNCAVVTVQTNLTAVGPVDTVGCPGREVRLCKEACGLGPITYMWYKGSVIIAGANTPCLVFPSVSLSDAGRYCVKVTGALNSVINCAVLTVQTNLTLIGPVDTVGCPGREARLCAEPC